MLEWFVKRQSFKKSKKTGRSLQRDFAHCGKNMTWPYEYTPYIWPFFACAVFLVAMGLYAFRDRTVPGAVSFIVLLTAIMLWVLANALGLAGTDDNTRIFWFKFERALILPAVIAELCFALEYAGLGKWVTRRAVFALAVLPFLFALLILTNDTHHLVWTQIWSDGNVHVDRGPASWGAVFYAYFISLLHLMVLTWLFARSPRHRWIAVWLILSPVIIRATYFLDIIHWNPIAPLNPVVVVVNFLLLPYALAVFRFHMFAAVPVVRDTVMEKMTDGMMVLDAKNRIADVNEAAQETLNVVKSKVVGREVTEVLQAYPELLRLVRDSGKTQCEALCGDTHARWYQISILPLIDRRGFHLGHLILFHDITDQRGAQAQIMDQQRTLAMLNERELLARDLHDGIGQIIAAAHLQAKSASELLAKGETVQVESCLRRLADITQEAKGEQGLLLTLRCYLKHYSQNYGIHTELVVSPELKSKRIDGIVEIQLQPIILEALTNVRKHAEASSARVNVALCDGQVRITIEDDGRGFDPKGISAYDGFGIRSMRGRAEAAGWLFEMNSASGKGTRVTVRVPLQKEEP